MQQNDESGSTPAVRGWSRSTRRFACKGQAPPLVVT
jgi:hypothetical protein